MNNYLCYHVHQHSVQPIYVRQTPTVILQTQQRMPITLDLPPQNIILRNEEPQPIIVRQQNPNVMIQNESYGCPIDTLSMDQIHQISNSNINLTSEIPTRTTTTNFMNTFGNVVDPTSFDSRNIMNIQEQPFNQTRTIHKMDASSHLQPTMGISQTQIETQGSVMIENGKEIGSPMGIMEGNKFNKVESYGYIPRPASMNNIYIPNNNNINAPGIVEMNNNNNNNNYSSTSGYPPMMNYQMEQSNFNNPGVNNHMSYMSPTPMMNGPPPIPVQTNPNVNIPYGNNPTPYMQNKNTNYVHTNENMSYYPEYKY